MLRAEGGARDRVPLRHARPRERALRRGRHPRHVRRPDRRAGPGRARCSPTRSTRTRGCCSSAVPDPATAAGEPIEIRKGRASAAVDPPPGCRFVDRCPLAIDVCSQVTPELVEARAAAAAHAATSPHRPPPHREDRPCPINRVARSPPTSSGAPRPLRTRSKARPHEDGRGESVWDRFCATPGKVAERRQRRDRVRLLPPLSRRHRADARARPRRVPLLDRVAADPSRRPRPRERGGARLLRPPRRRAARQRDRRRSSTLFHWDTPQALEDEGGWPARGTVEAFVEYVEVVAARLGDRVAPLDHAQRAVGRRVDRPRLGRARAGPDDARPTRSRPRTTCCSRTAGRSRRSCASRRPDAQVGITLNLDARVRRRRRRRRTRRPRA